MFLSHWLFAHLITLQNLRRQSKVDDPITVYQIICVLIDICGQSDYPFFNENVQCPSSEHSIANAFGACRLAILAYPIFDNDVAASIPLPPHC